MVVRMKTILETCQICGEPTLYSIDGYDIYCDCECQRKERVRLKLAKYKKLSITDRESGNNTFENCEIVNETDAKYLDKFQKYSQRFNKALSENIGILMCGLPGTGKTYYANCIANAVQEKGYTVLSFNLSGYLRKIKDDYGKQKDSVSEEEKLLLAVKEADLLIIDDLGSEKLSEWGMEKIYNLLDERYKVSKPLIITTNLSKTGLEEHLMINNSNKLLDRIMGVTKPFTFNWESRRKVKESDIWD